MKHRIYVFITRFIISISSLQFIISASCIDRGRIPIDEGDFIIGSSSMYSSPLNTRYICNIRTKSSYRITYGINDVQLGKFKTNEVAMSKIIIFIEINRYDEYDAISTRVTIDDCDVSIGGNGHTIDADQNIIYTDSLFDERRSIIKGGSGIHQLDLRPNTKNVLEYWEYSTGKRVEIWLQYE